MSGTKDTTSGATKSDTIAGGASSDQSSTIAGASNVQMKPSPLIAGEDTITGNLLQPTLPEGILPVYLAKMSPAAADAAVEAGAAEVEAAPPPEHVPANVDDPTSGSSPDAPQPQQQAGRPPVVPGNFSSTARTDAATSSRVARTTPGG